MSYQFDLQWIVPVEKELKPTFRGIKEVPTLCKKDGEFELTANVTKTSPFGKKKLSTVCRKTIVIKKKIPILAVVFVD